MNFKPGLYSVLVVINVKKAYYFFFFWSQVIAPQPNPFTGEVDYEGPSESTYDTEEDLSAQDLVRLSNTVQSQLVEIKVEYRNNFL